MDGEKESPKTAYVEKHILDGGNGLGILDREMDWELWIGKRLALTLHLLKAKLDRENGLYSLYRETDREFWIGEMDWEYWIVKWIGNFG